MTKFEGCFLTAAGLALSSKSGTCITFTRAETGSGVYESKNEVRELTALKKPEQEVGIESVEALEAAARIVFYVTNEGLEEGYELSEIGVYAVDGNGTEILYCVAFALPGNTEEIVPEKNGSITYCKKFSIETAISVDADVRVDITGTGHEWTVAYINTILDPEYMKEAFYETFTNMAEAEEATWEQESNKEI